MGYAAAYGRLDTLSCLITYGCDISDQTVTTLLAGDLAVGAPAFNKCIWKGITTARYIRLFSSNGVEKNFVRGSEVYSGLYWRLDLGSRCFSIAIVDAPR